ncbi:MAG TPA: HPr family phosphocarrier protein, partial [Ktedonobacteraceae bacterium]|nr:HPr family phosphocarrier protein [Ktedonobacteraceae bacterium]
MITIDEQQVLLHTSATSKTEAIRQVGQLLVESGCIEAGYVDSMLGREQVANTYLGNGIAIPHGLPADRDLIKRTGVAVVQAPYGVTWNPGETAQLIVGIAAKSDEHIEVLRRLTRVLGDMAQVNRLTQTNDSRDIIEALTGERPAPPAKHEPTITDYPTYFDAIIQNKTGLHARPAAFFVDLAKRFQADIKVRHESETASGKSLIALLQLGVTPGSTIRVSAQGADASAALDALRSAIASGLGDEMEEQQPNQPTSPTQTWTPQAPGITLSGVSASGGLAIGVTRQFKPRVITVEDMPGDALTEGERFQEALNAAQAELNQLYEEVKTRLGSGKAAIFRVHAELLNDAEIIQQTIVSIFQRHSAAWSWQQVINERVNQVQKLDDPVLAGRAVDLSDVGQRVLRQLVGMSDAQVVAPETPVILLAEDLTPSDTAALDPDSILGFCTVKGGPTSHTAILARSMGIPAIVGAGATILDIANGTPGILDGTAGKLYLKPGEADVQAARALQQRLQHRQDEANTTRFAPATTSDGYRIEVAANINRAADAPPAVEAGAEGVGLMRTEFLFLERTSIPTEEEQFEEYRDMALALGGRPLIIRTLDIGGDKEVPYLNLPKEDNSFLGIRGVRFTLARPDLFIPQLR